MDATNYTVIKDPIHGSIELHPLLMKIINTEAFNKLKYTRQLGGLYYVYPGATHTRFEHSIGVSYLAGEYGRMLQRKHPEHFKDGDILSLEIAGLCHDLGHGPFSHLFDSKVLNDLTPSAKKFRHEDLSVMVLQHIYDSETEIRKEFTKEHLELDVIKDMIDPKLEMMRKSCHDNEHKYHRMFLYEIVANKSTGIDVDKWDYFIRDCHYMGLQCEFEYRRLMQVSCIKKAGDGKSKDALRICYSRKEANNILGMFRTRASLYEKAYRHKTVIAVDKRLSTAMLAVKDLKLVHLTISEKESRWLTMVDIFNDLKKPCPVLDGYLALTDDIIHVILNMNPDTLALQFSDEANKTLESANLEKAKKSIKKLFARDIFRRVSPEIVKAVEIITQSCKSRKQLLPNCLQKHCDEEDNFHVFLQEEIVKKRAQELYDAIKKDTREKLIPFLETDKESREKPQRSMRDIVSTWKPRCLSCKEFQKFYKDYKEHIILELIFKLETIMREKNLEIRDDYTSSEYLECLENKVLEEYFYDIVLLMLPYTLSSSCEGKKLTPDDFFVEKVKLSYGSEKGGSNLGPLVNSEVLFFSKDKPDQAVPLEKEQLTPLFTPKKYQVTDVWIYFDKKKIEEKAISSGLEAMLKATLN